MWIGDINKKNIKKRMIDRDQISLWAKQVAKGKISEAEFEEKVKSIN